MSATFELVDFVPPLSILSVVVFVLVLFLTDAPNRLIDYYLQKYVFRRDEEPDTQAPGDSHKPLIEDEVNDPTSLNTANLQPQLDKNATVTRQAPDKHKPPSKDEVKDPTSLNTANLQPELDKNATPLINKDVAARQLSKQTTEPDYNDNKGEQSTDDARPPICQICLGIVDECISSAMSIVEARASPGASGVQRFSYFSHGNTVCDDSMHFSSGWSDEDTSSEGQLESTPRTVDELDRGLEHIARSIGQVSELARELGDIENSLSDVYDDRVINDRVNTVVRALDDIINGSDNRTSLDKLSERPLEDVTLTEEITESERPLKGLALTEEVMESEKSLEDVALTEEIIESEKALEGLTLTPAMIESEKALEGLTLTEEIIESETALEGLTLTEEMVESEGELEGVTLTEEVTESERLLEDVTLTEGTTESEKASEGLTLTEEMIESEKALEGLTLTEEMIKSEKALEGLTLTEEMIESEKALEGLTLTEEIIESEKALEDVTPTEKITESERPLEDVKLSDRPLVGVTLTEGIIESQRSLGDVTPTEEMSGSPSCQGGVTVHVVSSPDINGFVIKDISVEIKTRETHSSTLEDDDLEATEEVETCACSLDEPYYAEENDEKVEKNDTNMPKQVSDIVIKINVKTCSDIEPTEDMDSKSFTIHLEGLSHQLQYAASTTRREAVDVEDAMSPAEHATGSWVAIDNTPDMGDRLVDRSAEKVIKLAGHEKEKQSDEIDIEDMYMAMLMETMMCEQTRGTEASARCVEEKDNEPEAVSSGREIHLTIKRRLEMFEKMSQRTDETTCEEIAESNSVETALPQKCKEKGMNKREKWLPTEEVVTTEVLGKEEGLNKREKWLPTEKVVASEALGEMCTEEGLNKRENWFPKEKVVESAALGELLTQYRRSRRTVANSEDELFYPASDSSVFCLECFDAAERLQAEEEVRMSTSGLDRHKDSVHLLAARSVARRTTHSGLVGHKDSCELLRTNSAQSEQELTGLGRHRDSVDLLSVKSFHSAGRRISFEDEELSLANHATGSPKSILKIDRTHSNARSVSWKDLKARVSNQSTSGDERDVALELAKERHRSVLEAETSEHDVSGVDSLIRIFNCEKAFNYPPSETGEEDYSLEGSDTNLLISVDLDTGKSKDDNSVACEDEASTIVENQVVDKVMRRKEGAEGTTVEDEEVSKEVVEEVLRRRERIEVTTVEDEEVSKDVVEEVLRMNEHVEGTTVEDEEISKEVVEEVLKRKERIEVTTMEDGEFEGGQRKKEPDEEITVEDELNDLKGKRSEQLSNSGAADCKRRRDLPRELHSRSASGRDPPPERNLGAKAKTADNTEERGVTPPLGRDLGTKAKNADNTEERGVTPPLGRDLGTKAKNADNTEERRVAPPPARDLGAKAKSADNTEERAVAPPLGRDLGAKAKSEDNTEERGVAPPPRRDLGAKAKSADNTEERVMTPPPGRDLGAKAKSADNTEERGVAPPPGRDLGAKVKSKNTEQRGVTPPPGRDLGAKAKSADNTEERGVTPPPGRDLGAKAKSAENTEERGVTPPPGRDLGAKAKSADNTDRRVSILEQYYGRIASKTGTSSSQDAAGESYTKQRR